MKILAQVTVLSSKTFLTVVRPFVPPVNHSHTVKQCKYGDNKIVIKKSMASQWGHIELMNCSFLIPTFV